MKLCILLVCLIFFSAVFAVEPGEGTAPDALQSTLTALQEGARSNQMTRLSSWMSRQLDETLRLHSDKLERLSVAADCIRYLQLTESIQLKPETELWLLADSDRLHLLTDSILQSDDLKRCFQGLEKLIEHDPAGREKYFKLMLALSVVWDQPKRPPLHHQMGKEPLPYKPALTERYDYFKKLYASGTAKFPYKELAVRDLIFVVDTPVPLSELQWAQKNVKGSLEEWGEKFSDIIYDTSRISANQYQWPHGSYRLSAIRGKGGICVDQAYYATMTARALGIPAMCFGAAGKSGSHKWFSYMKSSGEWALNVGRYESEEYTTGWTMNPQTNKEVTDHDMVYATSRAQDKDRMETSDCYVRIAQTLINDPDNVSDCLKQARKIDPLNLQAWQIEMDLLIADKNCRDLLHLFDELRVAFKDYPDVVVDVAEKIGTVLNAAGLPDEAAGLIRQTARKVDDGRDDLARFIGMDQIEALVKDGNIKRARHKMEDLLEEHIEDGRKTFSMIRWYLKTTQNTDQSKAAAKFLKEYMEKIMDSFDFSSAYKKYCLKLLLTAYEQAGDEKGVAEVKSRLADL